MDQVPRLLGAVDFLPACMVTRKYHHTVVSLAPLLTFQSTCLMEYLQSEHATSNEENAGLQEYVQPFSVPLD